MSANLARRQALAEARLAEVRRHLAERPDDHELEDEEYTLEGDIALMKIMASVHEFAVTMARLKMAEKAHLN